ncbi:MAG: hypothetical protein WCP08_08765 [Prolixibacteraceae bacterium]
MSLTGEILRCPQCGQLLIDNPKRNLFGSLLFFAGFLMIGGLQHFGGANIFRDLGILLISGFLYVVVRKLTITKKDLVIRNKESQRVSYIDFADWDEILENAKGKENKFEIIENF